MHSRKALRDVQSIQAVQRALQAASSASLAAALQEEQARLDELSQAEVCFDASLSDWRQALTRDAIDPGLLALFGEAPALREADVRRASNELDSAKSQTTASRGDYAAAAARVRQSDQLAHGIGKRLDRRAEEKTQASLELALSVKRGRP